MKQSADCHCQSDQNKSTGHLLTRLYRTLCSAMCDSHVCALPSLPQCLFFGAVHQELGLDAFLEAYRILDDVDEDVDDDFVVDEMERILGQEKMGFIGLIHQLLISEEFIFHQ